MQLNGIPDQISWTPVRDFLESLGIDLNQVVGETGGVRIGYQCIEVELYALDAAGSRYLDLLSDEVATNHVRIPIVHDELRGEKRDASAASGNTSP